MKSLSVFSKLFFLLALSTVGFLSLATYATEKAQTENPQLLKKLEDKYNMRIHMGGLTKKNGPQDRKTSDTWHIPTPAKSIVVKLVSGNVSIKKSNVKELTISASGILDKEKSPRLLETDPDKETVTIKEPSDNAVEDLNVQIEIPASFNQDLIFKAVSGNINLENLNFNSLELHNVSGEFNLNNVTAKNLAVITVSGSINAEGSSLENLKGKSVSGNVKIASSQPMNVDFKSVSGDVTMKLNPTQDTHFSLHSVSGKIENQFGSKPNAKHEVVISTTSGDIKIE